MGVGSRGKRLKRGFVFGTVEIKEFSGYRGIALCPENFVSVSAKKAILQKESLHSLYSVHCQCGTHAFVSGQSDLIAQGTSLHLLFGIT